MRKLKKPVKADATAQTAAEPAAMSSAKWNSRLSRFMAKEASSSAPIEPAAPMLTISLARGSP